MLSLAMLVQCDTHCQVPAEVKSLLRCIAALLRQEFKAGPLYRLLHEEHCDEETEELSTQPRESASLKGACKLGTCICHEVFSSQSQISCGSRTKVHAVSSFVVQETCLDT